MKKRILASFLSLVLVLSLVPASALAAEEPPQDVDSTVVTEAPADPSDTGSTEPSGETPIEPPVEEPTEPEAPVCAQLEGCVDGAHDPKCPLYVEPEKPVAEPEILMEELTPAEPVEDELATGEQAVTGQLDLSNGSIVITETGYMQGEAQEETPYRGDYTISQSDESSTTHTITVKGGTHTIALNNVKIDLTDLETPTLENACAFAIEAGEVTLMLADNSVNTLKSSTVAGQEVEDTVSFAGLWVKQGASLTIDGNGELNASGSSTAGGNGFNSAAGAGIGACGWGHYAGANKEYYTAGDITIDDGTVTATGSTNNGYKGPGIGGGWNDSTITITGGTVTATTGGGNGCAGIGGAYGYANGKKTIVISGGTVTANGGAAGIGGGAYSDNYDITISGNADVTAESLTWGAGIGHGGGSYCTKPTTTGTITIEGGTVKATGSPYGAGIGGAGCTKPLYPGFHAGESGTITITGGTVTATGGNFAPGIGSGGYGSTDVKVSENSGAMGAITITGGKVTAANGKDYPGTGDGAGVEYNLSEMSTGIGLGKNPGTTAQTDFINWALQTVSGDAVALKLTDNGAVTRNGKSFSTGTLVCGREDYLVLPEGYYTGLKNESTDGSGVLVTKNDEMKTTADALIKSLNDIDLISSSGEALTAQIELLKNCEKNYDSLSETFQYYVNQNVKSGHTLQELKNQLNDKKISVTVTLDANGGTVESGRVTVPYNETFTFEVPTKANYTFDGWYLGNVQMTDETGTLYAAWDRVSDTTLTAKWKSEIEGTGTKQSPYELKSAANLVALSHISLGVGTKEEFALFGKNANAAKDLLNAHYKLTQDVTLNLNPDTRTENRFYGINDFTGTFDGNEKTITLNIDTSDLVDLGATYPNDSDSAGKINIGTEDTPNYISVTSGLFNSVNGAVIQNLTTAGTVKLLAHSSFSGVMVGTATDVTLTNCTNNASLTVGATHNTSWAGGLVGYIRGKTASFTNCTNTGDVEAGTFSTSAGNSCAAGIFAYASDNPDITLTNCRNTGNMTAERKYASQDRTSCAAGLGCSYATGKLLVENCSNSGKLHACDESGNVAAGLLVFRAPQATATIQNCENSGEVIAENGYAALICGSLEGTAGLPKEITYNNCHHKMSGENCDGYKLSGTEVVAVDGALKVPVANNVDNFFIADRYVEKDGSKVADIISADNHHVYHDFSFNENIPESSVPFQSWADAYVIRTAEDYTNLVKAIRGDKSAQDAVLGNRLGSSDSETKATALAKAYVKIAGDFTLSDPAVIGLGTLRDHFSGKIDGQNHTITYEIQEPKLGNNASWCIGFIGMSNGAEMKDLSFDGNINITVAEENSNNIFIGAAVAYGSEAKIENCHSAVSYTGSRSTVSQESDTVGYLEIGGLVGKQDQLLIQNSTHDGDIHVTSPKYAVAGGIGAHISGTVINCIVKGDLQAEIKIDSNLPEYRENAFAGGLVGQMEGGEIANSTAAGILSAANDAPAQNGFGHACIGGLVASNTQNITITNCNALTTGTAAANKGEAFAHVGGMVGLSDRGTTVTVSKGFSVKTDTVAEVSGATAIDTTVLVGGSFGDTKQLTLPSGVTLKSTIATFADDAVTYSAAGTDVIKLLYDGKVFYISKQITVLAKPLTTNDVTVTGINNAYPSDEAAKGALDTIEVLYGDQLLVKDRDYTVTQDVTNHKFTITFKGNYSGTVSRTYTVTADAPIVTVKNHSGVYDAAAHSISVSAPAGATVTYGVNADSLSAFNPSYKNVGTYVVYWKVVSGGQSVTGAAVVEITPAQLIVKADDQSIRVGDALPTSYSYTVSGWQGNDGEDADNLLTNVTVSCSDADSSKEGSYDIIVSGPASIRNYEITYEKGTLTVSRRSSGGGSSSSGSSSGDYTVSVDSDKHGTVTVSPKRADKGDTVTITVKPDKGYELDELTVTDKHGDTIKIKDKGNGKFTFTMPGSKVTVEASFKQIDAEPELPAFVDVPADAYYADAVAWAVKEGITTGTSATTFTPNASCTRAQMVTFLWRANGSPKATGVNPFTDVSADAYYYDAVLWAAEKGITSGTTATTFSPNATLTRGQTVTFLWRANGSPAVSGSSSFGDVASDAYYANAVAWAVSEGVTSGTSANTFSPNAPCTRAQIVTFLYRDAQ